MAKAQPAWTWKNFRLFDDEPKSRATPPESSTHGEDPCRLEPIVHILSTHLRTAIEAPPGSPERRLRLGLFGGLGQGKTSAIHQAMEQLLQERRIPKRLLRWQKRQLRWASFDVAGHKPDSLEFDFDRLMGQWYFGLHLGRLVLMLLGVCVLLGALYAPLLHLVAFSSGYNPWRVHAIAVPVLLTWSVALLILDTRSSSFFRLTSPVCSA